MNTSRFAHVILVCGSRTYDDMATIRKQLDLLLENTLIVHGACGDGADWLAELVVAQSEGKLTAIGVPADWKLGKKGGPLRNKQLLHEFQPEACLAFHDTKMLKDSPGTFDMVSRVKQKGIPVRVIGPHATIRQQVEWRKEGIIQ